MGTKIVRVGPPWEVPKIVWVGPPPPPLTQGVLAKKPVVFAVDRFDVIPPLVVPHRHRIP